MIPEMLCTPSLPNDLVRMNRIGIQDAVAEHPAVFTREDVAGPRVGHTSTWLFCPR
jgi:hypothetical protein